MFFLGSLYLQRVLGYTALEIGLAFLPATLIMGVLTIRYAEVLVTKFGARRVLFPGLILIALGLVVFSRAPVDGGYAQHVLPAVVLLGLGAGTCFPALLTLAMSGATPEDAGLASGLVNTTAQVGGALGLAVLATLSATRTDNLLAGGDVQAAALTSGYQLAFMIGAGLVVAAIAVAAAVLQSPSAAPEAAEGQGGEASGEPVYSEAG